MWEHLRGKINPLTTLKAADQAALFLPATNEVDAQQHNEPLVVISFSASLFIYEQLASLAL